MKKIVSLLLLWVLTQTSFAQIFNPVKWEAKVEKLNDQEYYLIYEAEIEENWHLYSQFLPEGGALPTEFIYDEAALNTKFTLVGKAEESATITEFDKVFEMDLTFFDHKAIFTQKIAVSDPTFSVLEAEVAYQVCDDARCLFQSEVLQFNLNSSEVASNSNKIFEPVSWSTIIKEVSDNEYQLDIVAQIEKGWKIYAMKPIEGIGPVPTEINFLEAGTHYEVIGKPKEPVGVTKHDEFFDMEVTQFYNEAVFSQRVRITDSSKNFSVTPQVTFMACDATKCLPPTDVALELTYQEGKLKAKNTPETADCSVELTDRDKELSALLHLDIKRNGGTAEEAIKKKSNFKIFFLGFLGGLIALLTPCVFPMIPLTVSFFTKGAKDKRKGISNAVLYGFFILLIYILLSLPFHLLDSLDPEILNNISTNVVLNVVFFVIFMFFAFSFFGYYELTLPSSWSNKMDEKATSAGGMIGIFFMAITLALVSFSCTGPILGSLLGGSLSSDGGAIQLTVGMGGFGLALALPFALFAMFPGWLNSLPKSGGWLNSVKVVLGFLELALALKFLSNADLVEHWGILKREVFIALWIIIFTGLALYILGKIKFPHDSPLKKLSFSRISFGALIIAFVLYLIPGLTNTSYANLKLLSGFPPPLFYSIYEKESNCPLDLECYKDFEEGLAAAKAQNKPIMLDFTGWACVNCRKMEEQVWSKEAVYNLINENYVLISLYVDDRKELPEDEQFSMLKSNCTVKEIRTIGDKWATFQTLNFKNNSQPYYVLLDTDMNQLGKEVGYMPNAEEYANWLKNGLQLHQQNK